MTVSVAIYTLECVPVKHIERSYFLTVGSLSLVLGHGQVLVDTVLKCLLIRYNSVYYNHVHNYYTMVGWSVWGSKQKEGFVLAKSALWPCEILNCFMVNNHPARIKGRA